MDIDPAVAAVASDFLSAFIDVAMLHLWAMVLLRDKEPKGGLSALLKQNNALVTFKLTCPYFVILTLVKSLSG